MAESNISHLRIYQDCREEAEPGDAAMPRAVAALNRSFFAATGWPLRYVPAAQVGKDPDPLWSAPVDPGVGGTPGHLTIGTAAAEEGPTRRISLQVATALASCFADVLGELFCCQTSLAKREAELAAGIPVTAHPDEAVHIAERLLGVLRGGAEGIGCQAAGLYLLDAATTQLKLRSCWGMPPNRLTEPARPLRGAVADLEALTGHAVVLTQPALLDYWCVPEPCAAAVCVPVSTATTLLGTLWMFSHDTRDFSDRETNLIEIIAGRLAGELEREVLVSEGMISADLRHQLDAGRRVQESQLPRLAPLADRWQLAGWTCQATGIGGLFHDWFSRPDGAVAISVGNAQGRGVEAALVGQAVRSAIRAHAAHETDPGRTLAHVSHDLWSGSAGDQFATAAHAVMAPDSGTLHLAAAGDARVFLLTGNGWEPLARPEIPLGVQSDQSYTARQATLDPGDALIITTGAIDEPSKVDKRSVDEGTLTDALGPVRGASAARLVGTIRELLEADPAQACPDGWAAMVIAHK